MTADGVTYVGHSTLLIEVGGTRLLTDPVLRDRVGYIRRIVPRPAPDAYDRLDAVLITHAHHDHLDLRSLRLVPRGVPVIAPPGCGRVIRRWTSHETIEIREGGSVPVGALQVRAIHADHDGRRLPVGPHQPAVGYVIEGSARICVYGDTDVFDGMAELAGDLDVAVLPVWGWGPKVGPGHMNPERAAEAAALLQPRIAVPAHWGTLARSGVWWRADPERPARRFAELVAERAPAVAVRILAPGERLAL
jgi:L-ascorbate metabolism protein UlaG (beta-lactamase superfamily)